MKIMKNTLFILVSLILLSVFKSQAQGATQILGGVETEGTLQISIYDNGDMAVYRYSNGYWQEQWYDGNCKSTLCYIDGTDYAVDGSYYNGDWFYSYATSLTTISNTSSTDTAELVLEKSDVVSIKQTIYYPPGAAYFTLQWEITNLSDSTVDDLRFFSGGDTYSSGIDAGAGFWEAIGNTVGVRNMITDTSQQNMYMQGNTIPYAYESRYFGDVGDSVVANALTDAIDPDEGTDNGMALEWRKESLAAGATWTINASEKFITKEVTTLLVSAPISSQVAPGSTIDLTYSVTNLTDSETSVTLDETIDLGGWTAVIQSPSSPFTLADNASQDVVIQVTCPGGTALGTIAKVTLEATNDSGTASDFCNVEAAQVPTITSQPSDRSVNAGESASFTISADNATSYQWQEFTGSWRNVTNEGIYSGATSTTLNISSAAAGMNAYKYRCVATNDYRSATSTIATLRVSTLSPGTYYVNNTTGNDANDGSANYPWKTLHHAISQINAVASGTYVLHVALGTYSINVSNGESDTQLVLSQSGVTIKGENGSAPIIDGTNAQNWTKGLEITGSNVTVVNLYVTGFSDTDEEGIRISGGTGNEIRYCKIYGNNWGIRVSEGSSNTIRNCDIYDNSTHGIDIIFGTGTTVVNNKIHDNPLYGIRTESSPEISRNLIYDNTFGIRVEALNETSVSPTIENNVIYEVASGAMSHGIYTLAKYGSSTFPVIRHNTIDGGVLSGIYMEEDEISSSAPTIKYNIITNFGQYGIQNVGGNPTIEYNDVWNNTEGNYSGIEVISNTNISEDPLYSSYSLQAGSPCINTIPSTEGDPVTLDYPGFTRPRPGETAKTMGAYEYVADVTNNYTFPGGTGVSTDYRIFTVPLNLGTGADMLTAMENVLGSYDPTHWRAFLYMGTVYPEFNSSQFASQAIVPGMGFWIITTYTNQIPFEGGPAPDGVDYVMDLDPGWHLIGLPWTGTQISLGNMSVTDGVNSYAVTSDDNNLTQQYVWDYTGEEPNIDSGYVKRETSGFLLSVNTGYFFKVVAASSIRLTIPHNNNQAQDAPVNVPPNQTNTNEDDEAPPPPPGSEPSPDIKANGQDGPVTVSAGDSVSVSVSLDPGAWSGRNADWWVAAHTPFDPPLEWYTYVYPMGWLPGVQVCLETPLFELTPSFNVLNMVLPVGNYIFYFAVDGNMDGEVDATWLDFVEVNVE